jgi:condensin complex subunit 1
VFVSLQLLTILLENNPFMGSLDPEPYTSKLQLIYDTLKSTMPADILEAQETALKEAQEADDADAIRQIEGAALAAAIAKAEEITDAENATTEESEFRTNVKALKFAQSALDFIDQFEGAHSVFQGMLLSSNTSDVTEALRFFVRARHFKLPCAITGMKHALSLMWSTEQAIRDEVLAAFVEVFIAVPGTDGTEPLPDNQIAHNLLVLVGRATVSEMASIEEALRRLVKDERIPADVFLILWSVASKASGNARAAALAILSMAGSADRSIVDSASRLRLLLEAGLGDYTEEQRDWKTARAAACALQRVDRTQVDPASAKYIVLAQLIERLCMVSQGEWCVDGSTKDTLAWFSAAEQAIVALFVIAPEPEVACAEIIQGMTATTFGEESCHSLRLARFFFVLGHIALKLLVYTESISGAVRRANATKSLKKQEIADKAKTDKRNGPRNGADDEEDPIEAELGIAAEIDAENERKMADIADKEILGRGLISKFGPLLVRVVGNEGGRFNSEVLMQSATLALCKFMCISSSFCEENLPLLFTALANAPAEDTTLRANTVVALGDHAFRFPNEVEPYTPRVYACLRDGSTTVRRHTLMVLTHLILNDMVKVKGQVCEIAMYLQDDDLRIRDMSRLLFHELSKRSNNPVYNLLPDIISQLSQQSLKKEEFRSIMSFLLAFIKKERQNEMLVEKLCHRFPNCKSISQKADLAFCIAQLKVNDKAIKCLSDLFKLYKDALFDEDVRKSFSSIVSKTKKFAKPETKECLEEWEAKLNEHATLGEENQRAGQKAVRAKAKAKKRATRKKRLEAELNDDELSFASDGGDVENKENQRSARKPPRRGRPIEG